MKGSYQAGTSLFAWFLTSVAVLILTSSIAAQGAAPAQQGGGRGRGAAAPPGPPAPPAENPKDLQEVWSGNFRVDSKPKMKPVAQKLFDDNTEELRRKVPVTKDPAFWCTPVGIPHIYNNGIHPFEILQTPARTFIFYEADRTWRTVWTDGRSIPNDVEDLWLGYSVGHWEGDEFVVETAGFNDKTWLLLGEGSMHSTKLRVIERFKRVDRDNLQIKFRTDRSGLLRKRMDAHRKLPAATKGTAVGTRRDILRPRGAADLRQGCADAERGARQEIALCNPSSTVFLRCSKKLFQKKPFWNATRYTISFDRVNAPPSDMSAVMVSNGMNTIGDAKIGIRKSISANVSFVCPCSACEYPYPQTSPAA